MFFSRMFNKKIVYHTGAWSGNFGDSIIQQSIRSSLLGMSKYALQFKYINCQQTEFTIELIDEINTYGSLLIIGGGGLIFYRPQDKSKSGWQWNIDINLIDQIKIPIVIYSIGYNQFEYDMSDFIEITNQHLQKCVEKASLFSVRNSGTKRELIRRGCNGSKILVVPDSGMFLKPESIVIPGFNPLKFHIGFNWTTDRENQTFPYPHEINKNEFISACVQVLNHAINKKNAQVFYIGHMSSEFDREIINILKTKLISEPIIIDKVLSEIYPPSGEKARYLVDIYRQMDIVLGMRGHANIVSFGQNTPFIGLGSHQKIRYFIEDIGRQQYFFDVRNANKYTVESMVITMDKLIDEADLEKKLMMKEYLNQKKILDSFNRQVLDLLK